MTGTLQINTGVLAVGGAPATAVQGDISLYRVGGPTTGYMFLGNSGARYLGYDGTNYVFNGAHVYSAAGRLWGTGDFNIASYQPLLGYTHSTQRAAA